MGTRKSDARGEASILFNEQDPVEIARRAVVAAEESVQAIGAQIEVASSEIERLSAMLEQTMEDALAERNTRRKCEVLQRDLEEARTAQVRAAADLASAEREKVRAGLLAERVRLNEEAVEFVQILRSADLINRHRGFLSRDNANARALEEMGSYPERNREASALAGVYRDDVERLVGLPGRLDHNSSRVAEQQLEEAEDAARRERWEKIDPELQRAIFDAREQLDVYPERVCQGARGSGQFAEMVGLPAPKDWQRIATGDLQHLLDVASPRGAREALLQRLRAEDDERARQERAAAEPSVAGVRLGNPRPGAPVVQKVGYAPPWRRDDPNPYTPPWRRDQ